MGEEGGREGAASVCLVAEACVCVCVCVCVRFGCEGEGGKIHGEDKECVISFFLHTRIHTHTYTPIEDGSRRVCISKACSKKGKVSFSSCQASHPLCPLMWIGPYSTACVCVCVYLYGWLQDATFAFFSSFPSLPLLCSLKICHAHTHTHIHTSRSCSSKVFK